jgi:hypothetical protein
MQQQLPQQRWSEKPKKNANTQHNNTQQYCQKSQNNRPTPTNRLLQYQRNRTGTRSTNNGDDTASNTVSKKYLTPDNCLLNDTTVDGNITNPQNNNINKQNTHKKTRLSYLKVPWTPVSLAATEKGFHLNNATLDSMSFAPIDVIHEFTAKWWKELVHFWKNPSFALANSTNFTLPSQHLQRCSERICRCSPRRVHATVCSAKMSPRNTYQLSQAEVRQFRLIGTACSESRPSPGVYVYDFEQNAGGWVKLKIPFCEARG